MTNQEWLQQNNAKIEAMQEKLAHKVIAKGTIEITENGKYDVAGYSDANVNVPVPDLSATTATVEDVLQGKKFYNAEGEFVEGSYKDMLQQRVDDTKSCKYLFAYYELNSIPYLNKINTSSVVNMDHMFYECTNLTSLDLSNFDTSNVTNMSYMFCICRNLTSLDVSSFNTSNVSNMQSIFSSAGKLSSIDLSNWDTRNVTIMQSMFYYCYELETIIGKLDVRNCTTLSSMFERCGELKNVTLKNIKVNITLGSSTYYGTKLTNETLINTAQELWDNTDNALGGSRKLYLSTTSKTNIANIYVKLIPVTDEMRAEDQYIDNKKPCVVCESTDEGAMTLTEYVISKNWAIV